MSAHSPDRSGLENPQHEPGQSAEIQQFCGTEDAQDALFTPRSAACDGSNVGTDDDALARIPRKIKPFSNEALARGEPFEDTRYTPVYYGDGNLWFVMDHEDPRRKVKLPPLPPMLEEFGPPLPLGIYVDRMAAFEKDTKQVYFIGSEAGPIKIGFSYSARERLKALQSASPVGLTSLAARKGGEFLEGVYHHLFAAHRLHGEWFSPAPKILAEIARLSPSPQEQAV